MSGVTMQRDQKVAVGPCSEIDAIVTKNGKSVYRCNEIFTADSASKSWRCRFRRNLYLEKWIRVGLSNSKMLSARQQSADTVILQVAIKAGPLGTPCILRDDLGLELEKIRPMEHGFIKRPRLLVISKSSCTQSDMINRVTALLG